MKIQWKYLLSLIIILLALFGTALYKNKRLESTYLKNNKEKIVTSAGKLLSTDFHYPIYSTSTHIVSAEIENITFQDKGYTYDAQIFKSIKGVSEQKIIEINNELTNEIFKDGLSDIRNPKNRVLSKDIYIDSFVSQIRYVDKGIIQYFIAYEIDVEGAAHPARYPGHVNTIYIDGKYKPLFKTDTSIILLKHFYPNGKEILANEITEADRGDNPCYETEDFPDRFEPSFNAITREVVYEVYFSYSQIGICQGEVQIAISLEDILKEVPQYIADDSLLLKFR